MWLRGLIYNLHKSKSIIYIKGNRRKEWIPDRHDKITHQDNKMKLARNVTRPRWKTQSCKRINQEWKKKGDYGKKWQRIKSS